MRMVDKMKRQKKNKIKKNSSILSKEIGSFLHYLYRGIELSNSNILDEKINFYKCGVNA